MSQKAVVARFSKPLAEFIGTFALVFCGTGAMVVNEVSQGAVSHVGVGLVWGAVVLAMIYTLGEVSGAHINPAVTISFWATGKFKGKEVPVYVFSQIAGAIAASYTLKALFPTSKELGATIFEGSIQQAFVLEFIISFFLMFVILNVATGSKEQGLMAGISIAFYVMLAALFEGPITRASMNPARSIGPALASGLMDQLWLFIVAPTVGALTSIPFWKIITFAKNNT